VLADGSQSAPPASGMSERDEEILKETEASMKVGHEAQEAVPA
jgi:hypothetical protein